MTYDEAMAGGEDALADGDLEQARRLFAMAHELGKPVRRRHVAAHRALIRVGVRSRRWDHVATEAAHLAAGFVFDWPRRETQ